MYEKEFPKVENQFLRAEIFQDQEIPLTFKGWGKRANEDIEKKDGSRMDWKKRLKFQLRYSYPEWAIDEAGEKIIKDGKPLRNRNYDPKFPKGYSIVYFFEEGTFESGSLPLFNAFCMVRPKAGDLLTIQRTGKQQETKWKVRKIVGAIHAQTSNRTIDLDAPEMSGDPEQNPEAYSDEVPF